MSGLQLTCRHPCPPAPTLITNLRTLSRISHTHSAPIRSQRLTPHTTTVQVNPMSKTAKDDHTSSYIPANRHTPQQPLRQLNNLLATDANIAKHLRLILMTGIVSRGTKIMEALRQDDWLKQEHKLNMVNCRRKYLWSKFLFFMLVAEVAGTAAHGPKRRKNRN